MKHNINKAKNPVKQWPNNMNKVVSNNEIQMASRHIKIAQGNANEYHNEAPL